MKLYHHRLNTGSYPGFYLPEYELPPFSCYLDGAWRNLSVKGKILHVPCDDEASGESVEEVISQLHRIISDVNVISKGVVTGNKTITGGFGILTRGSYWVGGYKTDPLIFVCNFGVLYNPDHAIFDEFVNSSVDQCQEALDEYFGAPPMDPEWQEIANLREIPGLDVPRPSW